MIKKIKKIRKKIWVKKRSIGLSNQDADLASISRLYKGQYVTLKVGNMTYRIKPVFFSVRVFPQGQGKNRVARLFFFFFQLTLDKYPAPNKGSVLLQR